jgi:hypothetical protein
VLVWSRCGLDIVAVGGNAGRSGTLCAVYPIGGQIDRDNRRRILEAEPAGKGEARSGGPLFPT